MNSIEIPMLPCLFQSLILSTAISFITFPENPVTISQLQTGQMYLSDYQYVEEKPATSGSLTIKLFLIARIATRQLQQIGCIYVCLKCRFVGIIM